MNEYFYIRHKQSVVKVCLLVCRQTIQTNEVFTFKSLARLRVGYGAIHPAFSEIIVTIIIYIYIYIVVTIINIIVTIIDH